jgi:hypothetical protein
VDWKGGTNILEEHAASIFRAEDGNNMLLRTLVSLPKSVQGIMNQKSSIDKVNSYFDSFIFEM